MDYELRRTNRRTVGITVSRDGAVIVHAPHWASRCEIERIVSAHENWIVSKLTEQAALRAAHPEPDAESEAALRRSAAEQLAQLVERWSRRMDVKPTSLRITSARTRFGSCSSKNSLCFSWRLMQYPLEAVEAVVVHELAHIRHHNHSAAFYAEVEQFLPDYRQRVRLLRG